MKKNRIRLKKRVYPVIWSGILVASLYLIFRFAVISFSDNVGQADFDLKDAVFSGLCKKVMESGASLIGYSAEEEKQKFPFEFMAEGLALQEYAEDVSSRTAEAKVLAGKQGDTVPFAYENVMETMSTKVVHNAMELYGIPKQCLSREYILTNGAVYNSNTSDSEASVQDADQLQIGYEEGNVYYEDDASAEDSAETASSDAVINFTADQLKDINFLVRNFYIVDSTTKVTDQLFDAEKLISMDMTLKQDNSAPQILIYHTHSQEAYVDSRSDHPEDTVVGVGTYLADILKNDYGYNVIHDTTTYDIVDGELNRNVAYTKSAKGIDELLSENPSIEVVIDLHRDAGKARIININGKNAANIMLFNGLSRDQNGPITYLDNPNLQGNLAFSLQLQLKSNALYPGLFHKNYLKSYRYNLNVRPKALLVELGTEQNTLESAMNAMVPFADVLDQVLKGE